MWYPHVIVVDASSPGTCALMNGIQQPVRSAPSDFPAKNHRSEIAVVRSKRSSKGTFSENFLATGGFFERNTYRTMALGCLKKKDE